MHHSRSVLTRRPKQKQKFTLQVHNKKSTSREKQKETKKQVLSKKAKGFVPENGEGRSSE
jgi:ubiquinone biosynthesis protein COQ9